MLDNLPSTRYMGSKHKILNSIWNAVADLKFETVLDAFSGSASVSYLFKARGKKVIANDLLHFCYHYANAIIANDKVTLTDNDLEVLLCKHPRAIPTFIQDNFSGLYFEDADNAFLDQTRTNIDLISDPYKRSLALSALVRACLKKRPRGIFAYTGFRYDDGRLDIQMSLREHFIRSVTAFNQAVFDNGKNNEAFNRNIFDLSVQPDLVYIDPPYYSPRSDSDYLRRYHFVEGLVRYWQGIELQEHTKTKKFNKYPTDFDGKESTYTAFKKLFEKYQDSILVISYSSNSLPSKDEMLDMLNDLGKHVDLYSLDYKYSFGTQHTGEKMANTVQEYIFVAQ